MTWPEQELIDLLLYSDLADCVVLFVQTVLPRCMTGVVGTSKAV